MKSAHLLQTLRYNTLTSPNPICRLFDSWPHSPCHLELVPSIYPSPRKMSGRWPDIWYADPEAVATAAFPQNRFGAWISVVDFHICFEQLLDSWPIQESLLTVASQSKAWLRLKIWIQQRIDEIETPFWLSSIYQGHWLPLVQQEKRVWVSLIAMSGS